jgi:hypothetical protein
MNSGSETESQRTTWSGTGSPDKTARCRRNPGDIGIIRCCRGPLRGGLSARGAQRTARRHRTRRISRNSKLFSGRYIGAPDLRLFGVPFSDSPRWEWSCGFHATRCQEIPSEHSKPETFSMRIGTRCRAERSCKIRPCLPESITHGMNFLYESASIFGDLRCRRPVGDRMCRSVGDSAVHLYGSSSR